MQLQVVHARKADMCALKQIASKCTPSKMLTVVSYPQKTDIQCSQFSSTTLAAISLKDAVVLELCCGTAGLTASFKRCGLKHCIAVDKVRCKGAKASVTQLDLIDFGVQCVIIQWLHHPSVVGLFWAPPFGTASAARQIDIPGEPGPKPLESILEPDGLEGLDGMDLLGVSQANVLYAFCAESIDVCIALGKPTMCENPRGSFVLVGDSLGRVPDCNGWLHCRSSSVCLRLR